MKNTILVDKVTLGFERGEWRSMSAIDLYLISFIGDIAINGDVGGAYEPSCVGDEDSSIDFCHIVGAVG